MSFVNRTIWRSISSSTPRKIASVAPPSSGSGAHSEGTRHKTWKMLSLFVALPAVGLAMANAYFNSEEHPRPEFVPYEHMRIRTKRFPWGSGQKSLYHNSHTNPLPGGYEDEIAAAEAEAEE